MSDSGNRALTINNSNRIITVTGGTEATQVDNGWIISQLTAGTHYIDFGNGIVRWLYSLRINADYYDNTKQIMIFASGRTFQFGGKNWTSGNSNNMNGCQIFFANIATIRLYDGLTGNADSPANINLYGCIFNISRASFSGTSSTIFLSSGQHANITLKQCEFLNPGIGNNSEVFFRIRRSLAANSSFESDIKLAGINLFDNENYQIRHDGLRIYGGSQSNGNYSDNIFVNRQGFTTPVNLYNCTFNLTSDDAFVRIGTTGLGTGGDLTHSILNPTISNLNRFQTNWGDNVSVDFDFTLTVTDSQGVAIPNAKVIIQSEGYTFPLSSNQSNASGIISSRLNAVYVVDSDNLSAFSTTPRTPTVDRRAIAITVRAYGYYDHSVSINLTEATGALSFEISLERDEVIENINTTPTDVTIVSGNSLFIQSNITDFLDVYLSYKRDLLADSALATADTMSSTNGNYYVGSRIILSDNVVVTNTDQTVTIINNNTLSLGANATFNMRYQYREVSTMYLDVHLDYGSTPVATADVNYVKVEYSASSGSIESTSAVTSLENSNIIEYNFANNVAIYCMHQSSKIGIARNFNDLDDLHLGLTTIANLIGDTDIESVHD